jgi:hypothetical protein
MDMESMQRFIMHLTNDIIDLKKNKGEDKKPFKPFLKKKTHSTLQIPPTLGINLEDYAMENYCCTHHVNHSERTCPEFINSFTAMLIPPEPPKKENKNDKKEDEEDQREEEGEEPPSHLNLIWDEEEISDDDDDDIMEEACVGNDYNIQSKGAPKSNDSPSTMKTDINKNATEASTSKHTSTDKYNEKEKEKEVIPSKSPISLDLTQKNLGDLKLDYDLVEYLKKMKTNITVFELCKITQLREQLRESLQHIQIPQDVIVGDSKVTPKLKNVKTTKIVKASSVANTSSVENKEKTTAEEKRPNPRVDGALIGRKSRSQTPPFLLTFDIFNQNVHNCLVDSGASSNVMPYSFCKKLNTQPQIWKMNIIQLDQSHVKVLGELKDVLIRISSNSKVHQMIDIIVVDLP